MSIQWTFFPFGLKWKPLLRLHVMISVKTFSPEFKSMTSCFIKNIYNFDIFYHFPQFEPSKSEVWKGKNLCAWGVKIWNYSSWKNFPIFGQKFVPTLSITVNINFIPKTRAFSGVFSYKTFWSGQGLTEIGEIIILALTLRLDEVRNKLIRKWEEQRNRKITRTAGECFFLWDLF